VRPPPSSYAGETLGRPPPAAPQGREHIRFPWPKYPGAKEKGRSRIVLNQVPIVEQTLEARGQPERVLAFYRRVMHARGWRDNTESFYHIERNVLGNTTSLRNLQDENYLRRYDAITRSKLSLVRKDHSILIEVSPGEKGKQLIELRYAGTPSIMDMVQDMADQARRSSDGPAAFLEAGGAPGAEGARSRVFYSETSEADTFRTVAAMLEREGWQRTALPKVKGLAGVPRGPHQAFFSREDQVALLAVKPAGREGTAAIVTESSAGR
jgi:hypothetical protein